MSKSIFELREGIEQTMIRMLHAKFQELSKIADPKSATAQKIAGKLNARKEFVAIKKHMDQIEDILRELDSLAGITESVDLEEGNGFNSYADLAKRAKAAGHDPKKDPNKGKPGYNSYADMAKRAAAAKKAKKESVEEALEIDISIDEAILEALAEANMLEDMMNEDWDETQMALGQLKFIEYACDEIAEYLEEDVEDMPEWFQNKLTMAFAQMQSLHSYAEGDRHDDEDEEDEDEMDESTKAYGNTMRQQAIQKQRDSMKPGELDKLAKIRAMLNKEKKKK